MRDPGKTYVIKDATEEDLLKIIKKEKFTSLESGGAKNILKNRGWEVRFHNVNYLVIPDFKKNPTDGLYIIYYITDGNYAGTAYKGSDIEEAITNWRLKTGLKGDALETWSDILGID